MEWTFAILSGMLQAYGYLHYAAKAYRREIEPNPTSWLMWGYGTALIFVFSLDSGASAAMLVLPGVCALSSIVVGIICWRHGTLRWPTAGWERSSLQGDLALTTVYAASWIFMGAGLLSEAQKETTDIAALVVGNLSTVVTFVPIFISTWREPRNEHPFPWSVWSLAYVALAGATLSSPEWTWYLLVYPLECLALHLAMACLSRRRELAKALRADSWTAGQ